MFSQFLNFIISLLNKRKNTLSSNLWALQVCSSFDNLAAIDDIKSSFLSVLCLGGNAIFLLLIGYFETGFLCPLSLPLEGVRASWVEGIPYIGPSRLKSFKTFLAILSSRIWCVGSKLFFAAFWRTEFLLGWSLDIYLSLFLSLSAHVSLILKSPLAKIDIYFMKLYINNFYKWYIS